MQPLEVYPVKTRIFHPRESLAEFIVASVPEELVFDGMILAITSKIVSLAEGQTLSHAGVNKKQLVESEADTYLGEIGHGCHLTIKSGLLIPSAGIDESNSEAGDYILYPRDPFASAVRLWTDLRARWQLEKLGVVLTDSHTSPLRRGVTGIALSYAGIRGIKDLVGELDLFGRPLKMTQMNLADGLAAAAVLMMGEAAEARPLAVVRGADVEFSETLYMEELQIALEEDLYYPVLKEFLEK
jgi:dihydrofolate synthase / folylpolyglutamate synthase